MNFTSFTGSSRKGRNVNLSGQKTTNPFGNSSTWGSSSSTGAASQTVAAAQAERQARQLERDRRQAALRIQRTWRGSRTRGRLRDLRRQQLDQLLNTRFGESEKRQRIPGAVVLALAALQVSQPADRERICRLARLLLQTDFEAFRSGEIHGSRLRQLFQLLLSVFERDANTDANSETRALLLGALVKVIGIRPQSILDSLRKYYKLLGVTCRKGVDSSDPQALDLLRHAIVAPLQATQASDSSSHVVYQELAVSFLTQAEITLFEENVGDFARHIDMDRLSLPVLAFAQTEQRLGTESSRLWLLSHFIALHRTEGTSHLSSTYLKALYTLLSLSSLIVRNAFAPSADSREEDEVASLPSYVASQLQTLVTREAISSLLKMFTMGHSELSPTGHENGVLLASYILTLIHCFPAQSDEIRMRLYLADIATAQGQLPAVKYFWETMRRTAVYSAIVANSDVTVNVLRRDPSSVQPSRPRDDIRWDREWQTVLLFLELYTFVLRLTDDEDFLNPSTIPGQNSRLRSSGLSMTQLDSLARFLKHLGFNLYYRADDIQQLGQASAGLSSGTSDFLAPQAKRTTSSKSSQNQPPKMTAFNVTTGAGFTGLRDTVTTAMRMLYERDSRRKVLPEGHWLMTSKFDMDSFLQAVAHEEDRRRQMGEESMNDDEEDTEMEDAESSDDNIGGHVSLAGQRRTRNVWIEQQKERHRKESREKLLASFTPKLEILRNMPFVIPFDFRTRIFRQFVHVDKQRRRGGYVDADQWRLWQMSQHPGALHDHTAGREALTKHSATIHRGHIFQDALDQFFPLEEKLKEPIQITFVDEWDMTEAGIDGGGVTKEFLTSVTKEIFKDEKGLFLHNENNSYYPSPYAMDQCKEALRKAGVSEDSSTWRDGVADLLQRYEFLGRIIGKCLYEGVLVDVVFAGFFLLKWSAVDSDAQNRANLNDLHELDEELYQGMLRLKNYPGDVRDLGLDFTIEDQVSLPNEPLRTVTRNLVPGGDKMPVTNENRLLYINYVARHRLVAQPWAQTRAFLRGLSLMIDPAWLGMFNQNELQRLVGGDSSEIDVEDLRAHTNNTGLYVIGDDGQEHPTVKMFWEVMHELADEERRLVLKFVTSTPRAPLLGFAQLYPRFTIHDSGRDQTRLPSASTCVNLLKLPMYTSRETLKKKLLQAVKSGAGFDLS